MGSRLRGRRQLVQDVIVVGGLFAVAAVGLWLLQPPAQGTGEIVLAESPLVIAHLEDAVVVAPGVRGRYHIPVTVTDSAGEQPAAVPGREMHVVEIATGSSRLQAWLTCSHELRHVELYLEGVPFDEHHDIMREEGYAGPFQYRIDRRCLEIR